MKVILLLLAFASTSAFAEESETVTVTGKRIDPSVRALPKQRIIIDHGAAGEMGGANEARSALPGHLSDAQIIAQAMIVFGESINKLMSAQAWGELSVDITTPDGLKVHVEVRAGFGKVEVLSKKRTP